jgi:hypothetical protein
LNKTAKRSELQKSERQKPKRMLKTKKNVENQKERRKNFKASEHQKCS